MHVSDVGRMAIGFSRSPSIVSGGASAASRRATYCRGASFQCGVKGESAGTGGCSALGRRDDVVAMATAVSVAAGGEAAKHARPGEKEGTLRS